MGERWEIAAANQAADVQPELSPGLDEGYTKRTRSGTAAWAADAQALREEGRQFLSTRRG